MNRESIFDNMKDMSDEEVVYEIFSNMVYNMSEEDREKFISLLQKGAKINGRRF